MQPLSEEQLERYGRQMLLEAIGVEGQKRLLSARVLMVGAGGLGSPAAIYLAAAGVGTIGIVDGDRVELSNLHRQILHFDHDLGRPKVVSARRHLEDLNPDVRVIPHPEPLTRDNALDIIGGYDLVVNGCDNFPTRYLVNDACVLLGKPLVDASILQFEGQATVFLPGQGCYRCLYPEPPPPGVVPSCAEAGIIGATAGHLGTLQALEAIKVLLGIGRPLVGRLVLFDGLSGSYRTVRWRRDPHCPACGDRPSITELPDYREFCGLPAARRTAGIAGAPAPPGARGGGDGGGVAPPGAAPVPELSARQVWERLGHGDLQVVDIRSEEEFRRGRIPGARRLALPGAPPPASGGARAAEEGVPVPSALAGLDPARDTVVVCQIGLRSLRAAETLRAAGFRRVHHLRGGMTAWLNLDLPLERDQDGG